MPAPDAATATTPPIAARRDFLKRGASLSASLATGAALAADDRAGVLPPSEPPWSRTLGAPILASPYGVPARYEASVVRRQSPGLTRTAHSSVAFTPLQNLFGVVTPSGVHFERHHAGVPDVIPDRHRLMIHGLVREPRIYTMDDIVRLPSVSRLHFIECGANTGMEWANVAVPTVQYTHGMIGCSEWTGVPLSVLLEEAGYDRKRARCVLAEGADGASLTRTIPLAMALDRRAGRLRAEWRNAAPGARLSAAPRRARRAGRVERQVAAPARSRRRALEHARGIAALHRPDARRNPPPIHVDPGSEKRHHVAFGRAGAARPRLSRDQGSRVVGSRHGEARRCLDRRRPQLAHGETAGAHSRRRR